MATLILLPFSKILLEELVAETLKFDLCKGNFKRTFHCTDETLAHSCPKELK